MGDDSLVATIEDIDETNEKSETNKKKNKKSKLNVCNVNQIFTSDKYTLEEKNIYLTALMDDIFPELHIVISLILAQ